MSTLRVVPVDPEDRRTVDRFIRVPWYVHRVHRPSPHWVPPLVTERRRLLDQRANPFFRHADVALWLLHDGLQDVGRIAAVVDTDWQRARASDEGCFGFFDCPDDREAAGRLLATASGWLAGRRVSSMVGPFDLSTNYSIGTLVEGFDSDPYIDMPYNPPYYDGLLRGCGLHDEKDLWQWRIDPDSPLPSRVARLAERVRERPEVIVRPMHKRRWDAEITVLRALYNEIWTDNWGFVPLGEQELRAIAEGLRTVVRPELALVVEVRGTPAAFGLVVPNVNPVLKRMDGRLLGPGLIRLMWSTTVGRIDTARLMLFGVSTAHRRTGLDALLYAELHAAVRRAGVHAVEIGWVAEDNTFINRALGAMGCRRVKRYRVYRKELDHA